MNDYPMKLKKELSKPVEAKKVNAYDPKIKNPVISLGLSMINFKDTLEDTPEVKLLRKLQQGIGSLDTHFRFKGAVSKIAPYNRLPVAGSGLSSYMEKHKLLTPVEIIKTYKKDKSLRMRDFDHLVMTLRQMNIGYNEALEYVCEAVNSSSQRYFYHRIEKEFLYNNGKALVDLVEYFYAMNKKDKANSINWLHKSKYLKDWAKQYNVEILGYDWFLKQFNNIKHHYDCLIKKFKKTETI
jgi:hypothetical protein